MVSSPLSPNLLRTLLLLLLSSTSLAASTPSCKSIPGDSSWPSPATWTQFNTTLSGQLLQPDPPGAVCHSTHSTYNSTLCTKVQAQWSSEFFHQRDPISAEWNNWNNDSCLPDERYPCSSSGYPVFVVNATTKEHVKDGVDFGESCSSRRE